MDGHIPHVDMAKCLDFKDCRWLMFRKNAEAFLAKDHLSYQRLRAPCLGFAPLGFGEFYVTVRGLP